MRGLLWLSIALFFFAIPSFALESYKNGIIAFEQGDYETALKEFKVLAKKKDSLGQYGLGLMYDLGTGVLTNFKEAV